MEKIRKQQIIQNPPVAETAADAVVATKNRELSGKDCRTALEILEEKFY